MAGRYVAGKISITGLDEVVRELERRGADVMAGVESICNAGAEPVKSEIAGRATDIEVVAETMQRTPKRVTVGVGPTKRYAFCPLARVRHQATRHPQGAKGAQGVAPARRRLSAQRHASGAGEAPLYSARL